MAAAGSSTIHVARASTAIEVLSPIPPDPAPPGVARFAEDDFAFWQRRQQVRVTYEAVAWPQIHDKIAANIAAGKPLHDVLYMSGWVPEFSASLTPLDDAISHALRADLPASSFNGVSWRGRKYGVVFTLSVLTLFFNRAHFDEAGIAEPPATWDDLKRCAAELTRNGRSGWVQNYGTPDGIGGLASYWMAFLQQAGGTMYGSGGEPVFNDAPGIDALQVLIDLMPSTHPSALSAMSINDATNVLMAGEASMMMNWPWMWTIAQDPSISSITGKLGCSVLPAGPAGSASIDGSDAWTVAASSASPEAAMELIEFYLDPDVQKRQVLDSGWLPIRLSTLGDPEVQRSATHAAVMLQQAAFPYDSFITPDYGTVTRAIGLEIQAALRGEKSAAVALADASTAVAAIVASRPSQP